MDLKGEGEDGRDWETGMDTLYTIDTRYIQ